MDVPPVAEILKTEDPPLAKLFELKKGVFTSVEARRELDGLVRNWKAIAGTLSSENKAAIRQGVALWLSGDVEQAISVLEGARSSRERDFILGLCHLELGRPRKAADALKAAFEADRDDRNVLTAYAEALVLSRDEEEGPKALERLEKKFPDDADLWYLKGLREDLGGKPESAVANYEKALELEPNHAKSLFRLASLYDLLGLEDSSSQLYEQLRALRPLNVNSMINMGVLYEDAGEYNKAIECYQAVVEAYPNHWKAAMYLKDAEASLKMFYDEEAMKKEERRRQLASQHIADMTLTTRAKNALLKARVFTMADLVGKTEEELLDLPGLGATAIKEIKELLHSKGLSLLSHKEVTVDEYLKTLRPEVLGKPLADFEWSGRVKKLFEKLGFVSVSDLLRNTEKDLLKNRNFGQTSLREIRTRLAQLGVELRAG